MLEESGGYRPSRKLLYVEDDATSVSLFRIAVSQIPLPWTTDLAVESAAPGALRLLTANECSNVHAPSLPDLIILDLHLPGHDGLWLLEEIRRNSTLSNLRVVFFTSSTDPEERQKALALGALAFVHKAADFDGFWTGVRTACSFVD